MKRDIKGPLPIRVRLGLGYQAICPGLDLVYTAEIRGQPPILLYKMIVSVCVQACQRKLSDRFVKFFLGVINSSMEIVRKILKFYIS